MNKYQCKYNRNDCGAILIADELGCEQIVPGKEYNGCYTLVIRTEKE